MKYVKKHERVELLKRAIREGKIDLMFLDSETAPSLFYGFSCGQTYISHAQLKEGSDMKLILIQYMFEGDKYPSYLQWEQVAEPCGDTSSFNDEPMLRYFVEEVYNKHEKPILLIGQNSISFDVPVLNWRCNMNGIPPIEDNDTTDLDTLRRSRVAFKALSHRLDYKSKMYGQGGKLKMDLSNWVNILNGDEGALEEMIHYGLKDVIDLKEMFWRELPYYKRLPAKLEKILQDMAVFCKNCAERKKGKYNVVEKRCNNRKGYMCNNCGDRWEA